MPKRPRSQAAPLRIVNLYDAADTDRDAAVPVHGADATGLGLHSNGRMGADLLWVPAGARFPVHTHPGDHLLYCVSGAGTITMRLDGELKTFTVRPGDLYLVDGMTPHAVGAAEDAEHVLLSIGSPHKPVDALDRMSLTDWSGRSVPMPVFVEATEPDDGTGDGGRHLMVPPG